eukprot:1340858-Rhodomonas_salina.3
MIKRAESEGDSRDRSGRSQIHKIPDPDALRNESGNEVRNDRGNDRARKMQQSSGEESHEGARQKRAQATPRSISVIHDDFSRELQNETFDTSFTTLSRLIEAGGDSMLYPGHKVSHGPQLAMHHRSQRHLRSSRELEGGQVRETIWNKSLNEASTLPINPCNHPAISVSDNRPARLPGGGSAERRDPEGRRVGGEVERVDRSTVNGEDRQGGGGC